MGHFKAVSHGCKQQELWETVAEILPDGAFSHVRYRELLNRKDFNPLWVLQVPCAGIYGLAVGSRLMAYRRGFLKKRDLPGFVLSIGNLTVGGTGKTPAVAMVAQWAFQKGYHVVVLSRGYGGRSQEEILEVSDGQTVGATPLEAGDEPYLLAKSLAGVPVVVSKSRYQAGMWARERYGSRFFILDDGFQHLRLKRDLDVALVDSLRPFGNGHLLPWGPLREPIGALARADACLVTRYRNGSGDAVLEFLRERFRFQDIFCGDHVPEEVVFPIEKQRYGPEFLKGKKLVGFAGIGSPQGFQHTLEELGANLVRFESFKDHHRFLETEIKALDRLRREVRADFLMTTEKDWIRISPLGLLPGELCFLRVRFEIIRGRGKFFNMVSEAAERKLGAQGFGREIRNEP